MLQVGGYSMVPDRQRWAQQRASQRLVLLTARSRALHSSMMQQPKFQMLACWFAALVFTDLLA